MGAERFENLHSPSTSAETWPIGLRDQLGPAEVSIQGAVTKQRHTSTPVHRRPTLVGLRRRFLLVLVERDSTERERKTYHFSYFCTNTLSLSTPLFSLSL